MSCGIVRKALLFSLILGLSSLCGFAQPRAWNSVKALASGTEIRVDGPRAGVIRGTVAEVTDDSLVIYSGSGRQSLSVQEVRRVSVKERGHRGRNTLIGLGIGAGVGLLFGALGDANCGGNCVVPKNFGKEALPPVFGGVGALVGVVIPTGGWRQIYKQ